MDEIKVVSNVSSQVTKEDDFSDIFVTEKDTFDISLKYYRKDDKLFVDSVDSDFDNTEVSREILMSFKHPDQSDSDGIVMSSPKLNTDLDKVDVRDFVAMEVARIFVLIRKWSVNKSLSRENILSLNPKIIKGMIAKIREKIGMDGIF
jgi:hypothetical protein